MAVVAKMRCDEVLSRGGGALVALCVAHDILSAWPPEKPESVGIWGHGEGECPRCDELAPSVNGCRSVDIPGRSIEEIKMRAVSSGGGPNDPNGKWAAATPFGELTLHISNPKAWGFFDPGADYVVEVRKHVPSRGNREA